MGRGKGREEGRGKEKEVEEKGKGKGKGREGEGERGERKGKGKGKKKRRNTRVGKAEDSNLSLLLHFIPHALMYSIEDVPSLSCGTNAYCFRSPKGEVSLSWTISNDSST